MAISGHPTRWCKGHLLAAAPLLDDPNFARTVVFMLEHSDEGAIGVVLNRPTPLPLPDSLDRWRTHLTEPASLFAGGPVERDALVALADLRSPTDPEWMPIMGSLGSIDLAGAPDDLGGALHRLRVFRGYAGWGPGQLDEELEARAWVVCPAEADDVFGHDTGPLWRAAVRRRAGRTSWVANAPDDLRSN